jgi:hypothetical protein
MRNPVDQRDETKQPFPGVQARQLINQPDLVSCEIRLIA